MEKRIDVFKLNTNNVKKTDQGFLKIRMRATRTGVLDYSNHDQKLFELKPPEEVFNQDSMNSLKNIPITIDHPHEFVDIDNISKYCVGLTGTDVKIHDGKYLDVDATIIKRDAVSKIEEKIKNNVSQEVSCGYTVKLDDSSGEYKNEKFDKIQRNIRYNHIACVNEGRAGSKVKILNHKHNYYTINKKGDDEMDDKVVNSQNQPIQVKLVNDGSGKPTAANSEIEALKKEIQSLKAKSDVLNTELSKYKKADQKNNDASEMHRKVNERIEILNKSSTFLTKDEAKGLQSLSNLDIKRKVVQKSLKDIDLSKKSDEYINSAFDLLESNAIAKKDLKDEQKEQLKSITDSSLKTQMIKKSEDENAWEIDLMSKLKQAK